MSLVFCKMDWLGDCPNLTSNDNVDFPKIYDILVG